MTGLPESVERLIDAFTELPGIGRRSAERMTFHLLRSEPGAAQGLARAVEDLVQRVTCCSTCHGLADADPCPICTDAQRDASKVLVVEQPRDLINLEATGSYRGVYHVLTGRIDPLGGLEPGDLTVDALLQRVDVPATNARGVPVEEVILGLNPDLEGDGTALYLATVLGERTVRVTRLARGLPAGSQLEYASAAVLADAIRGRRSMEEPRSQRPAG